MIEKVEGATMICQECKEELECHMSKYEGNYEDKLQWQNKDGSAHYNFAGKNEDGSVRFKCVIPKKVEAKPVQETIPQAKDFDKMQNQTLFDDGYARALRKLYLLRGIRKAIPNEEPPVIGMIFNQICADLRNQEI